MEIPNAKVFVACVWCDICIKQHGKRKCNFQQMSQGQTNHKYGIIVIEIFKFNLDNGDINNNRWRSCQ